LGDELHDVRFEKENEGELIKAIPEPGPEEEEVKIDGMIHNEWTEKIWKNIRPPKSEVFDYKMKVYGMSNGYWLINHYWISGPVLIFKDRFYMWAVADPTEIKPHTLEIFGYIKPKPSYLIIGTGDEDYMFDEAFYDHFRKMGIVVDVCKSFEACSTFNLCNEDDYSVACALIPNNFGG
jgi:uncharacterized protein